MTAALWVIAVCMLPVGFNAANRALGSIWILWCAFRRRRLWK